MSAVFGLEEQRRLLILARQTLEARVLRRPLPVPDTRAPLDLPRGAFVSIRAGRDLRGCLGRLEADSPLGRVVAHLAAAVCESDPRFAPVTASELHDLLVEISVLTPARAGRLDEVEVGRHGLIVEHRGRRGLLLPQVAIEHRWDAATFLRQTCVKAGLPADSGPRDARLYLFEAQVFAEPPPEP